MSLTGSQTAFAQLQPEDPAIMLQGRATKKSIKLRWAPNTPSAWHFANKYGYTIERVTLLVNGEIQQNPIKTVLNRIPLKPATQQSWETFIDSDDYVAIAAQAIFGETLELTNTQTSDLVKVMNKAKELETRFSFALFSADQSIKAAELSGLYFEDETIAPATKYLYRVYANVPANILAVDTGFVYLGMEDYTPLPKLRDVKAEFDDHMALISWNGDLLRNIYNSYWVERSDDGKTFTKITDRPVVNSFSGERPNAREVYKMDTLPENDKKYYYRVIGINAFGENSPPSDTVSGRGRPVFDYTASISGHVAEQEGPARLEWSFPSAGESLLRSFDLLRLDPQTKSLTEVKIDIEKTSRTIIDESPRSSNYYVIRANDRYGRSNNSFPYLVQLEDSIPPSAPIDLTGRVDTLGRVFLSWKPNSEDDLEGYHLYKSNFNSDEFIQVPGPILKESSYVDTIKLNNLTEKIYYKLQAVDKRFNRSDFSAPINLKKPDTIPPVPPVFTSIKGDSTGIRITWQRSDSEDVVEHLLYRKSADETEWTLVKTISLTDTVGLYVDTDVTHSVSYAYTILSVDDDLLESTPAEPLGIRWMDPSPYPEIQNIFYTVDKAKRSITVSWEYDQANVEKFLIYRADNGQPLQLYKAIDGNNLELKDGYKVSDNSIEYRIVAAFRTGERTKISKALLIKM